MTLPILKRGKTISVAHRGNSKYFPENTMISMESAYSIGVDILETDLRLTKDHELVLIHDIDVTRTTSGTGLVKNYTLDELQELDAGAKFTIDRKTFPFKDQGLIIPVAQEFFQEFNDVAFNVDLKDSDPIVVDIFLDIVDEYNLEDRILVGSFYDNHVEQIRKRYPEISTGSTYTETRNLVYATKLHLNRFLHLKAPYKAVQVPINHRRINIVNKRLVEVLHSRDVGLHVWTINDRGIMEYLINLGVDAIFTDDPTLLIETDYDLLWTVQ